jgi:hypothetical protein
LARVPDLFAKHGQFIFRRARHFSRALFDNLFLEQSLGDRMLHRMTTLLSTVAIAFLAISASNAVSSTSAWAAEGCLARPTGRLPHGIHWHYQTDRITHKKCWVTRIGNSSSAQSRAATRSVGPERGANILPPAVADANARFENTFVALRSHATAVTAETATENVTASKFESYWINLSDPARSSDPQSTGERSPGRQSVAAIPGDVRKSTKARGHSRTAERWPDLTLIVFLLSLGGALFLYALIGRSFLAARKASPVWSHIPAGDDIFRMPSEFETSGLHQASTAEPAGVPPDGVDNHEPGDHDLQIAADACPREIDESRSHDDQSRGQRPASSYRRLANPFAGFAHSDDGEAR